MKYSWSILESGGKSEQIKPGDTLGTLCECFGPGEYKACLISTLHVYRQMI